MSTATAEVTDSQLGLDADSQQYLTFDLAEEHYGVDILKVQEIKGYTAVTKIPNTPDYLTGVLNLRGTIVPIVDLRLEVWYGSDRTNRVYSYCRRECARTGHGIPG